jgi:hypothetical protein
MIYGPVVWPLLSLSFLYHWTRLIQGRIIDIIIDHICVKNR